MKLLSRSILLLAIIFLGWKAFHFLFPNDETRIRKKLTRLESMVSYAPNTSPIAHLAAAGGIMEMFAQDAELSIRTDSNTWNIKGRNEIKTSVLSSRQQEPSGMQVTITDTVFSFNKDDSINTLVTVTAILGSSPDPIVRILEFRWTKGERSQWVVSSIVTRKDLEWGN